MIEIKRLNVESTNIKSVGYEDGVLEVEFLSNGKVYQYFNVPEFVYQELLNSESIGRYFNSEIRETFEYEEIK